MQSTNRSSYRLWYFAAAIVILIFYLSRIHNLMALPYFLDESSHITRAQWVWQGQPFYLLQTGKALAPYFAALLWPFSGAQFIGRYVVILLGMVGLASAYGVGRELHSREAGLLVMALWIICPQLIFYERMALVDTTISAMAMLTLWLAIRAVRSGRLLTAILCGVALSLCVFAKTTGIVYIIIPAFVVVFITSRRPWRVRIFQAFVAYVVMALMLIGPVIYLSHTDADVTGQQYGLTTTSMTNVTDRLRENFERVMIAENTYFSPPMIYFIEIAWVFFLLVAPRRALLVLAMVAVLLGAICFAAQADYLWLRYASPAAPFMLLSTAVGLMMFIDLCRRVSGLPRVTFVVLSLIPWIVVGIWAVSVGLPFLFTAYRNPAKLNLPNCNLCDETEYINWIPSGFGIAEAADYIQQHITTPATVVGTAVNCNAARLAMPYNSPIKFLCYDLNWGGGNENVIADMQRELDAHGFVYVLGENVAIVRDSQLPVPWCEVRIFPRPDPQYFVKLYYIGKGANDDNCPPNNN